MSAPSAPATAASSAPPPHCRCLSAGSLRCSRRSPLRPRCRFAPHHPQLPPAPPRGSSAPDALGAVEAGGRRAEGGEQGTHALRWRRRRRGPAESGGERQRPAGGGGSALRSPPRAGTARPFPGASPHPGGPRGLVVAGGRGVPERCPHGLSAARVRLSVAEEAAAPGSSCRSRVTPVPPRYPRGLGYGSSATAVRARPTLHPTLQPREMRWDFCPRLILGCLRFAAHLFYIFLVPGNSLEHCQVPESSPATLPERTFACYS